MNRSVIDGCLRVAAGSLQLRTVELLLARFAGAVNGAEEVGDIHVLVFHVYMYMRMYNYRFMTRTLMFRGLLGQWIHGADGGVHDGRRAS